MDTDNILTNMERAAGISGQIKEFDKVKDLEDIIEILETNPISDESANVLRKNLKAWLNRSKGYILGRALAKRTEKDEIPRYILDMFDVVRKHIDSKEADNAG